MVAYRWIVLDSSLNPKSTYDILLISEYGEILRRRRRRLLTLTSARAQFGLDWVLGWVLTRLRGLGRAVGLLNVGQQGGGGGIGDG